MNKASLRKMHQRLTAARDTERHPPGRSIRYHAQHRAPIAVAVTCHQEYLPWLRDCVQSIQQQTVQPAAVILVLDGCDAPDYIPSEWHMARGNWAHPNPARNAALEMLPAEVEWVIWFDADDTMPSDYIERAIDATRTVDDRVAILYPDLHYTDAELRPVSRRTMPEYDYWELRRQNFIDTSSVWRRRAVEEAGGWMPDSPGLDDYGLALVITRRGWRAQRLAGAYVFKRQHQRSRLEYEAQTGRWPEALWYYRTLGIVTLMAGREQTLEIWARWLQAADLPPHTTIYVVDNSNHAIFSQRVWNVLQKLRQRYAVHYTAESTLRPTVRSYTHWQRHYHVADLYGRILPGLREDCILTLEDDVEPPPDGLRRLWRELLPGRRIGAIGGAYALPTSPESFVVATRSAHRWLSPLRWDELGESPIEVGYIGGGFTLWANWALQSALPATAHTEQGGIIGWDMNLCRRLRADGYRIWLHGGVRCRHHIHGETVQQ